eukprot:6709526-Prymnesium_polylepis.1
MDAASVQAASVHHLHGGAEAVLWRHLPPDDEAAPPPLEASEVVFGHLAMRQSLQSAKSHYEAARAQIRTSHGEAAPRALNPPTLNP